MIPSIAAMLPMLLRLQFQEVKYSHINSSRKHMSAEFSEREKPLKGNRKNTVTPCGGVSPLVGLETWTLHPTDLLHISCFLGKENLNGNWNRDLSSRECLMQYAQGHSSLIKWSTQNGATWQGGTCRVQAHAVWYHGIHQSQSNSSSWNISNRISLIKCVIQRLEKNGKGWHILSLLYKGGLSESSYSRKEHGKKTPTNNRWSEQPGSGTSLWEKQGSSETEKKVLLLAGFISAQAAALPDAAPTWGPRLPLMLSKVRGRSNYAVPDKQQKGFICTMLYTRVTAPDKFKSSVLQCICRSWTTPLQSLNSYFLIWHPDQNIPNFSALSQLMPSVWT